MSEYENQFAAHSHYLIYVKETVVMQLKNMASFEEQLHYCVLDQTVRDQLLTDVCQVCADGSLIDLACDWSVYRLECSAGGWLAR